MIVVISKRGKIYIMMEVMVKKDDNTDAYDADKEVEGMESDKGKH